MTTSPGTTLALIATMAACGPPPAPPAAIDPALDRRVTFEILETSD